MLMPCPPLHLLFLKMRLVAELIAMHCTCQLWDREAEVHATPTHIVLIVHICSSDSQARRARDVN